MQDFCYFYLMITITDIAKFCPKIMLYFSFQDTHFAQKSFLENQFYLTLNDFQMCYKKISIYDNFRLKNYLNLQDFFHLLLGCLKA